MKRTILIDKYGVEHLLVNEHRAQCPFAGLVGVPVQRKDTLSIGGVKLEMMCNQAPCNSLCAMFDYAKLRGRLKLNCKSVEYVVESVEQEKI